MLLGLARLALPLGVVTMIASLIATLPRYIVESLLGEASLGVFAALAYASVPGTLLATSLGQTVISRMSRKAAAGEIAAFVRLVAWAGTFALVMALTGVGAARLFGAWALELLYGSEYAAHVDLLVWIMLAAGVAYLATVLIDALTAARGFRIQVPLAVAVVLVQLAMCAYLVPAQGLIGAAKALLFARILQFAGSGVALAVVLRRTRPAEAGAIPHTNPIRGLNQRANA